MWLLTTVSVALALPWDCPVVVVPADAWPAYADQGAFADTLVTQLKAELAAWDDGSCPAVDCATEAIDCTEACCTTNAGAWWCYRTESVVDPEGGLSTSDRTRSWTVRPPSGAEPWREIKLVLGTSSAQKSDGYASGSDIAAEWTGRVLDGVPADTAFRAGRGEYEGQATYTVWWWASPRCTWSAMTSSYGASATIGATQVNVGYPGCDGAPEVGTASIDQTAVGIAAVTGWALLGDDCTALARDTGPTDTQEGGDDDKGEHGDCGTGGCGGAASVASAFGALLVIWARRARR